jgi:hypothetical protein
VATGHYFKFNAPHLLTKNIFTMALDWTMLDARHQFIPLHDETTIMSIDRDSQVEISLTIPPSGTAATGGNGVVKKMKERGRLWLTNKRVRLSLHIKVWV